jgi:4-oxalomesaconate tautomerase
MNLGDVAEKSVPKMTLVSAPEPGGTISTGSFIPHRVRASIGVFAAVTVATACLIPGSPAARLARLPTDGRFVIEHPTGVVEVLVETTAEGTIKSGALRTGRRLFDGRVFPREA